jgi:hypothetical protein
VGRQQPDLPIEGAWRVSRSFGRHVDLAEVDRGSSEAHTATYPTTTRCRDIARFGEDETVIMRREGGWIRTYRAHHKADTMATTAQIVNAMREIDAEEGKNDWVRAVADVPGVGGGVVDRLAELELPVVPYNGGEAPIDRERFVNARAEDWTLQERFE